MEMSFVLVLLVEMPMVLFVELFVAALFVYSCYIFVDYYYDCNNV